VIAAAAAVFCTSSWSTGRGEAAAGEARALVDVPSVSAAGRQAGHAQRGVHGAVQHPGGAAGEKLHGDDGYAHARCSTTDRHPWVLAW